jgi:hypothetical protein
VQHLAIGCEDADTTEACHCFFRDAREDQNYLVPNRTMLALVICANLGRKGDFAGRASIGEMRQDSLLAGWLKAKLRAFTRRN